MGTSCSGFNASGGSSDETNPQYMPSDFHPLCLLGAKCCHARSCLRVGHEEMPSIPAGPQVHASFFGAEHPRTRLNSFFRLRPSGETDRSQASHSAPPRSQDGCVGYVGAVAELGGQHPVVCLYLRRKCAIHTAPDTRRTRDSCAMRGPRK